MIMVVIIDNIGNSNMNEDLKTLNNSNHNNINIVIIRNNNQNNNFLIGHLSGNWQVLLL